MIKKFIFSMEGYATRSSNKSAVKPASERLINDKCEFATMIMSEVERPSIINLELEYSKVIRVLFRKLKDNNDAKFSFDIIGKDIPKDIEREIIDEEAFLFEYYSPNFIIQKGKHERFFPGFFVRYKPVTHIITKNIIADDVILPSSNGLYILTDFMHLLMPSRIIDKKMLDCYPKIIFSSEQIDELLDAVSTHENNQDKDIDKSYITIHNPDPVRICPMYPYMDMAIDIESEEIKTWEISDYQLNDILKNTNKKHTSNMYLDVTRTNEVNDNLNIYCIVPKESKKTYADRLFDSVVNK